MTDEKITNPLPCPFCGSTDLAKGSWHLDSDGEVDALECKNCYAGAPTKTWNIRQTTANYMFSSIEEFEKTVDYDVNESFKTGFRLARTPNLH